MFRAKLLAGIEAAGLTLPAGTPKKWVVDCKSVGTGESALIYLGRYLYRGVIREQDTKTQKTACKTVFGAHFLWLLLQHVLGYLTPYEVMFNRLPTVGTRN